MLVEVEDIPEPGDRTVIEYSMNEIIPNLWLGDLHNAKDTELLRSKNIHSILSVMRGNFTISQVRYHFPKESFG